MASNVEGPNIGDLIKFEEEQRYSRADLLVDESQTLTFGAVCQKGPGGRMKGIEAFAGAGQDSVQTITVGGTSTAGSIKLGFRPLDNPDGPILWTDTIAWSATEATMTTSANDALDDLLGSSEVVCATIADTAALVMVLTFSGTNATDRVQALISVDASALTGASTVDVVMTTEGGSGNVAINEVQTATTTLTPDGGTYTLSVPHWNGTTITTAALAWDANAATIETAINTAFALVSPAPTAGMISVAGTKIGDDDIILTYDGDEYSSRDWPLATVDAALLLDATVVCSSTFAETTKGSAAVAGAAVAILIDVDGVTTGSGALTTKGVFLVREAIVNHEFVDFGSGNAVDATAELEAIGIVIRDEA